MIDWLNDNSGAVQAISVVALAIVTAVYAWRTWSMSTATERQAEASASIVREMGEERLSSDRPVLVLNVPGNATYGGELTLRVYNAGRGPAVSTAAAYFRPPSRFPMTQRGSLLSGETWEVQISCNAESDEPPHAAWAVQLAEALQQSPLSAYAVALCRDIHGREWATTLELDWEAGAEVVTVGMQSFVQLQGEQ